MQLKFSNLTVKEIFDVTLAAAGICGMTGRLVPASTDKLRTEWIRMARVACCKTHRDTDESILDSMFFTIGKKKGDKGYRKILKRGEFNQVLHQVVNIFNTFLNLFSNCHIAFREFGLTQSEISFKTQND